MQVPVHNIICCVRYDQHFFRTNWRRGNCIAEIEVPANRNFATLAHAARVVLADMHEDFIEIQNVKLIRVNGLVKGKL